MSPLMRSSTSSSRLMHSSCWKINRKDRSNEAFNYSLIKKPIKAWQVFFFFQFVKVVSKLLALISKSHEFIITARRGLFFKLVSLDIREANRITVPS